jgi:hypothetical protein
MHPTGEDEGIFGMAPGWAASGFAGLYVWSGGVMNLRPTFFDYYDFLFLYAGAWAERKIGSYAFSQSAEDRLQAAGHIPLFKRSRASRKAHRLVDEKWAEITRLANVLMRERIVDGDRIRELIA